MRDHVNILGLSYGYHDAAACLVRDGGAIAAAEEERFSRIKHDPKFPTRAASYCLKQGGIKSDSLDAIVFYEKPAKKLERILQIGKHYFGCPNQKLINQLSPAIISGLNVEYDIRDQFDYSGPIYFCEHHLSHASATFYSSPFDDAAILTLDGVGEWATTAEFYGAAKRIVAHREIRYPHSLGLLYSAITSYLGFDVNEDEYKVMGLASYGSRTYRACFDEIITINDDGSFSLNLQFFSFMYDAGKMYSDNLEVLLGPARRKGEPIIERHRDIAASLQGAIEDAVVALAHSIRVRSGAKNLCLAGGVAQNCVANTMVLTDSGFENIFIQPAPGDSGAAMGAALWASHQVFNHPRRITEHSALLGPEFSNEEILQELAEFNLRFERLNESDLCNKVAAIIASDLIVGWFQGRMEFGPRALGGRSILANATSPRMKDILNSRVKFREEFRPFAPAVIEEAASEYFNLSRHSRFMLFTPKVLSHRQSEIPSVTHVDGTARVQTVSRSHQPLFHKLISSFGRITGTPIVINTSFNIRGEAIVCTPKDAIKCFLGTDIDFLAIGSFLVSKV
jgi:carbamoyltransferase